MNHSAAPLKRVTANWTEVVLICRKCSKKLKGGFGPDGDRPLAKALRQFLAPVGKLPKRRRASLGIVEVGCLGICPKRAVMAMRAGAPGTWLVIPQGSSIEAVARTIGLREPAGIP